MTGREMQISKFSEDLLGLQAFAEKLERFINIEHRFVSESLVISLNGGFGAGKTTFLKMWTDRIKNNKDSPDGPLVVEVNAWNDDYCGDPLVSLVSAIIGSLNDKNVNYQSLCNAAKDVGWFLTGIGGQVVSKLTGIDAVAAGELAEKKKSVREGKQELSGGFFDVFEKRKKALGSLKTAIRAMIKGDKPSVLILVDELDRCRPDYAISYLETIKHVFDIHGIVFILAVDRKQLECSAKAAFGADLNFPEYYRKFIQREISLPEPSKQAYQAMASKYVHFYLQRENERRCFMALDRPRNDNIVELISSMKMTPRQIQEVFRVMGHVLQTDEGNKGRLPWCLGVGTILMSTLRIGHPRIYEALGRSVLKVPEAGAFFRQLGLSHSEWWLTLCLTGGGLESKVGSEKELADIYRAAGFISGEEGSRLNRLGQWYDGWGHSSSGGFEQIYAKIEQISSWD